jgi:outer membrane protein
MRRAPSIALLLVLLVPHTAEADLLSRFLQDADAAGGAPPSPPPQSDDLTAWAGPARQTSLPALLQHAIQHSPQLQTAKIDIAIAEAQIAQNFARDDWHIDAQISASSSSGYFSGLRIDRSTTVGATVDVFRVLPTGGTINLHAGTTYSRTNNPLNPGDRINNWSDELSFTFAQPLLRGRGRSLYEANERRATLSRDVAVLAKRLAAINAVQTVVSAYWDLVLAERAIAITQSSLALANERLRITTIGNQGGKIPRSEIPAVQQIIATREEEILNAELAIVDRSIALRRAVGLPIGQGELGLRVGTDLDTKETNTSLGELTERAFSSSPELAQLAKQGDVVTLDIEVNENGLLPRLDAALTLGPTTQNESFTTALRDLARTSSIAISGQLRYQHSLGQEDVKGRARELRENRKKLEVTAFDIRAQIAQTMARAVAQLELAKRRLALSQRAIDLANENIKIEIDRFNLGRSTNFDVLSRQEELRQAELRKTQAMIDWQKALAIVQALTGDILPTYGITVD